MAINAVGAGGFTYQVNKTEKTQKKEEVKLSKEAQSYLKDLQSRYNNMDFTVASYETDEEAQEYLSKGNKDFSVLIDPETLEKMATDKETRKKYEDILNNAAPQFEKAKEELGEDSEKVASFGISIDKAGNVSYFANLMDSTAVDNKTEAKEDGKKADSKKTDDKKEDKKTETYQVKAGSMSELLAKIRQSLREKKSESIMTPEEKALGQSLDIRG